MWRTSTKSENREGPDSEDKTRREDRRMWRLLTRQRILNGSWERNRRSTPSRKTVKKSGTGNMSRLKLESDTEVDSIKNVDAADVNIDKYNNVNDFNIDIDPGYNRDRDDDSSHWRTDYLGYLESMRRVGNIFVSFYDDVRYEAEEQKQEKKGDVIKSQQSVENERGTFNKLEDVSVDEDWQNHVNSGLPLDDDDWEGIESQGNCSSIRNNSQVCDTEEDEEEEEKQTGEPMKSQQSLETQRGDASNVPKNNSNTENEVEEDYLQWVNSERVIDGLENAGSGSELKEKSSSDRQNAKVSYPAFDDPTMESDYDEEYQQFLNSGINLDDFGDCDIAKTNEGEDCRESSDSDLVLLEPNQFSERTPFVPSKAYDASWFDDDTKARDSGHFSQYRRSLMEDLDRPYDRDEHDRFLLEVKLKRQKERHIELRRGQIKSVQIHGVNKSYLQLYPDLAKAIDEFNEPRKVLFLLRGFFFWLKNMPHQEKFQPWRDASCLKILRGM